MMEVDHDACEQQWRAHTQAMDATWRARFQDASQKTQQQLRGLQGLCTKQAVAIGGWAERCAGLASKSQSDVDMLKMGHQVEIAALKQKYETQLKDMEETMRAMVEQAGS